MNPAIRKHYSSKKIWEKERFWATFLHKHQFPTAKIMGDSSETNDLWIDFEWIDGRSSCLADIDRIFATLQSFSTLGTKIIKEYPVPYHLVGEEKWTLADWLKEHFASFHSNATFWDMYTDQWNKQQYGVIHRDPHYFNWIVTTTSIHLLDFGLVSYGPILYDIAYVWANECKQHPFENQKMLLLWEWVSRKLPNQSFIFLCIFFSILKNYADYYRDKKDLLAENHCLQWIHSDVIHGLINECVKFHSNNGDKSIHY